MAELTAAQKIIAKAMSESELQANIIDAAHKLGWLVMHIRSTKTRETYQNKKGEVKELQETAYIGDPGFPDLVLVNGTRVLFWELKSESGALSVRQNTWLDALRHAHVKNFVLVLRPSDWTDGTIERLLKEGK